MLCTCMTVVGTVANQVYMYWTLFTKVLGVLAKCLLESVYIANPRSVCVHSLLSSLSLLQRSLPSCSHPPTGLPREQEHWITMSGSNRRGLG